MKPGNGTLRFIPEKAQKRLDDGPTDLLSNNERVPMNLETNQSMIGLDPGTVPGCPANEVYCKRFTLCAVCCVQAENLP